MPNWNTVIQIAQAVLDNKGQGWEQNAPVQPKDDVESGGVLFGSGSKYMIRSNSQIVFNNEPTGHQVVHIFDFRKR
ncbi:MAG: hypothetical protein HYX49_10290 [Chloroflexi bacterium]|nr:hypothetical protein [Chloroflexota bacterium]